ncbi:MAG: hypothetical protein DRH37_03385 [Deltaproteobacteria bacterium]|nr:MAG: hypothetical protein DRH37_03385 [Deltaproteobacteria bacterium]
MHRRAGSIRNAVKHEESDMDTTASLLAEFIDGIGFDDIPDGIVKQAKLVLLDSIGCALAGRHTDKGKIALSCGNSGGSPPESTMFGAGQKVSAPLAAFVNGELLNALDYDALCGPTGHVTPYVLSAPLAVAEWKNVGGKDLILAIVLAHEIAQRVCAGLVIPGRLSTKRSKEGLPLQLPIHGYGVHVFGGVAGVAKVLGLNTEKIRHAFGIGGAMCPIPTLMQFVETVPSSMSKFTPSGWVSQAEVMAALLAEKGYTGAENVFDGEFAFWKGFAADGWNPKVVVNGLGRSWFISDAIHFKRYPCCGAMHGALDIFRAIIDRFDIQPGHIRKIRVRLNLLAELALWKNRHIENHIDAQFSAAYVFAVAAHRIEIGHLWQAEDTYHAPEIVAFMKRINVDTPASLPQENNRPLVEIIVRDHDTKQDKRYTERDVWPVQNRMDEQELFEKFKNNAASVLTPEKIDLALNTILSLEGLNDVACLMEFVSTRDQSRRSRTLSGDAEIGGSRGR